MILAAIIVSAVTVCIANAQNSRLIDLDLLNENEVALSSHRRSSPPSEQSSSGSRFSTSLLCRYAEIVIDSRTGKATSYEEAEVANRRERRWRNGAADDRLIARLADAEPYERLRVALQPVPGKSAELRAALTQIGATVEAMEDGVFYATAFVYAWDWLKDRAVVQDMTLAPLPELLALTMAKNLGRSAISTSHTLGVGTGFIAAIWEPEACFNRQHPDFASVARFLTRWFDLRSEGRAFRRRHVRPQHQSRERTGGRPRDRWDRRSLPRKAR